MWTSGGILVPRVVRRHARNGHVPGLFAAGARHDFAATIENGRFSVILTDLGI